jgi:hypothetical protein
VPGTTYGDIEPVTRELINMAGAQRDEFGLTSVRGKPGQPGDWVEPGYFAR